MQGDVELLRRLDGREEGAWDNRVLGWLGGAGALLRGHGVRGVSCDADSSFEVGGRVFVLPLGIGAGGGYWSRRSWIERFSRAQ